MERFKMNTYFYEMDWNNYEEDNTEYTQEEIGMLLSKYDIDLEEEDEEGSKFSPMLQRHKR